MNFRIGPVVLIVLGVLFLLSNLGILQIRHLVNAMGTWWPLILIAVGVVSLIGSKK